MGNFGLGRKTLRFRIAGNGAFEAVEGQRVGCNFCGGRMTSLAVFVEFMDHIVCHTCVLSGPKEMAERIRRRIPKEREEWVRKAMVRIAKQLEKADSIIDIEGGLFALAVAKVYEEENNRRKARKGAAA